MRYIVIFILGFAVGKYGFNKTVTTTANTTAKVLETGAKGVDKASDIVDKGVETAKSVKK